MCDFSQYSGLSDEWLAVEATMPPPANLPLLERRKLINEGREAIASEAMKTLSPQVQLKDYRIPTRDGSFVQARAYWPLDNTEVLPVYIHLHGGGYLFGTLDSEDAICARICLGAGVVVLNVNYRHTPEVVYPAAWDDVQDAFMWVHENIGELGGDADKVIIGGISAGAHMTASLTLEKLLGRAATSCPPIAGQVLMIPCLVNMDCYAPQLAKLSDPSVSSVKENENAPILSMKTCRFFTDLLKIENPEAEGTKLNPGNATADEVRGLPPTVFGIAGLDPLRDEGLLYAKMLAEVGVPTDVHLFKGVPHGFRRYGDKLSACKKWDRVIEDGIRWILSKPEATEFKVQVE